MRFCYITSKEYDDQAQLLHVRFDQSVTHTCTCGTQPFHSFKPVNSTTVEVKHYSTIQAQKMYNKRVMKRISLTLNYVLAETLCCIMNSVLCCISYQML